MEIILEDRVLLIMQDNAIHGTTILQKYGFILSKQYERELAEIKLCYKKLDFYNDWKPYYYGPYSKSLSGDLTKCEENKTIRVFDLFKHGRKMKMYSLTIKGRQKWRGLFKEMPEMAKIDQKIKKLQKIPYYELIRRVYNAYPEFTTESKIKYSLNS